MKRFVYSPSVNAFIKTDSGIIDVSTDIISGSVTRRVNAASSANLSLQNPNRKYLRRIKPMDRIVIYLTRIKPMLVFSGYIDTATIDQLYPGPVSIKASCTLKRLIQTYWDPSLSYTQAFFASHGFTWDTRSGNIFDNSGRSLAGSMDLNNGIGDMLRLVMNEVGGWPIGRANEKTNTVHVLQLPPKFLTRTQSLIANELDAIGQQREDIMNLLKQLLTVDGAFGDPFSSDALTATMNLTSNYTDNNPLPRWGTGNYQASIYGKAVKLDSSAIPENMSGAMRTNRQKYGDAAAAAAKKYSIPFQIFFGLIRQESGWGTVPGGEVNGTNYAGAMGLTQVVPPKYGYNGTQISGNAELQLDIGAHYLSDMYAQFHDWSLALAAYNAGPGAVIAAGNKIPPFAETQAYVPNVLKWAQYELNAQNTKGDAEALTPDGKPGDVKVGPSFFPNPNSEAVYNYTFRIKGNPYGDDNMIFKIAKIDKKQTSGIAIWIPSNTAQADAWHDKPVTIESSIGQSQRFPKSNSKASSSPANIDPSKMTQNQLVHDGQSTAGLQPLTLAALAFIQTTFGPFRLNAGFATSGHATHSDHYTGLALDLEPVNANNQTDWSSAAIARVDALAAWAGWKPNNGGNAQGNPVTRWVGWRTEAGHGVNNHIHISFLAGKNVSAIPASKGGSSAGVTATDAQQAFGPTGVGANADTIAEIAASVNIGLPLVFPLAMTDAEANNFAGERALYNDVSLMEFVEFMTKASGRHFMSLPNGDFVAFYPDYFNWGGELPLLRIADIETMDLQIDLSDDPLATHVFTTADTFSPDGQLDWTEQMASTVASVESISTFRDLVNVSNDFDSAAFLKRYGARPLKVDAPEIKNSFMQFMYGWMTFLQHWAQMFTASPTFTFLPELYPGSLIEFESKDLIMYVEEVTHNFDLAGGFTTSATLTSPSTNTKTFDYGMVLSGGGFLKKTQAQVPSNDVNTTVTQTVVTSDEGTVITNITATGP
jgi:hypothetical protein